MKQRRGIGHGIKSSVLEFCMGMLLHSRSRVFFPGAVTFPQVSFAFP